MQVRGEKQSFSKHSFIQSYEEELGDTINQNPECPLKNT